MMGCPGCLDKSLFYMVSLITAYFLHHELPSLLKSTFNSYPFVFYFDFILYTSSDYAHYPSVLDSFAIHCGVYAFPL